MRGPLCAIARKLTAKYSTTNQKSINTEIEEVIRNRVKEKS
jgi:hypothetical protein